jgi:hypothetical protein
VRKRMALCALVLASASIARGQVQSDPVEDANASLQTIAVLMGILRSVLDARDTCVLRYPTDAETIRHAYDASSVPAYFDMLEIDDSARMTSGRANERPGFEDLDLQACQEGFQKVLDDFDARFGHRIEAMRVIRDEVRSMPPSLPFRRDGARLQASPEMIERAARASRNETLSTEGSKVRVVYGDASGSQVDPSCVLLISAVQGRATAEHATNALRNQAGRQGGDTVLVHETSTTASTTSVAGMIFRCS